MCETCGMARSTPHLTLIEGLGPASFDAEVARLLEEPDGRAAWEELKRLRRRVVPAANSPFAVVRQGSEGAGHATQGHSDIP